MEPRTGVLNDASAPGEPLSAADLLLRERLAALPLQAPPHDGWNAIRAQLQTRQASKSARQQAPWWMALAAVLAVLAIVPAMRQVEVVQQTPPELQALMQRSQALENQIRGLRANSADIADVQYQWESAIENDLALLDVGLTGRGNPSPQLWRERVRLLEELKTATQMESGPLLLQARLD